MNRCTFGLHKWVEKMTYKGQMTKLGGYICLYDDVCDICGKHKRSSTNTDAWGLSKIHYPDTRNQ